MDAKRMTDTLAAFPKASPQAKRAGGLPWRLCLAVCAGSAAVAGFLASPELTSVSRVAPSSADDTELLALIRFMAAIKGAIALLAGGLIYWRLRSPIAVPAAFAYIAAAVLMAAGPGLIWNASSIAAGALVFHCGLGLFLGVAWFDNTAAFGQAARFAMGRRLPRRTGTRSLPAE
jgi:hypothetical protein